MGGNSHQQPFANQQAWGKYHDLGNDVTITSTAPATWAAYSTYNVADDVPIGAQGIYITGGIRTNSGTACTLYALDPTATIVVRRWHCEGSGAVFIRFPISGTIPLDEDGNLYLAKSSADISAVTMYLDGYFL